MAGRIFRDSLDLQKNTCPEIIETSIENGMRIYN